MRTCVKDLARGRLGIRFPENDRHRSVFRGACSQPHLPESHGGHIGGGVLASFHQFQAILSKLWTGSLEVFGVFTLPGRWPN
jgi:hypothetical protein